jgi:FkbM family methyltransferase
MLLAKARACIIGKNAVGVICDSKNGLIAVPPYDLVIGRKLAFSGEYDWSKLDNLLRLVGDKSRVLVVGSHIGTIVIPIAKKALEVHAVEANPENFRFLDYNMRLNKLNNLTLHHFAASDNEGELEMILSRHNTGGSKIASASGSKRFEFIYDQPKLAKVPSKILDNHFKGEHFDLIVMDIEGGEYRALLGAQNILSNVKYMQLEILPNHIDNVAEVSKEDFLNTFSSHFNSAYVNSSNTDVANPARLSKNQFLSILDNAYINDYYSGIDVIFEK